MKLLAIDSSRRSVALALVDGEVADSTTLASDQKHESALAPAIRDLLTRRELTPKDLEGVVVGIGPGSFTGLRIGIAFGTLLARGVGCPAIGISGFEALVAAHPESGPVMVLEDDHPRGVYGGLFERGHDGSVATLEEITHAAIDDQLTRAPRGTKLLGSAVERHRDLIEERGFEIVESGELSAIQLARLGEERLRRETPEPWSVKPLYVQPLRLRPSR